MKRIITDQELFDYVSGKLHGKEKRELERRAIESGQTDLLLNALLLDYECTGTSTDDLIGADTFIADETRNTTFNSAFTLQKAADHISPDELKK